MSICCLVKVTLLLASKDQNKTVNQIIQCPVRIPTFVSPAARDLIQHILQKEPHDRLTLGAIRRHRWFAYHLPTHSDLDKGLGFTDSKQT